MKPNKLLPSWVCSFCVSVLLVFWGLVLVFIWPFLMKFIISIKMVLTPQAEIFNPWKTLPVIIPTDFYFFNWTNPEDIYNHTIKPRFRQVGPYRFLQTTKNTNITWNDNGTVTFRHQKIWHYDKHFGDVQDRITTLNIVALTAAYKLRSFPYAVRKSLSLLLSSSGSTIATTRTISEMLFEGFSDPLLKLSNTFRFVTGDFLSPWDKVGVLYARNGSVDYEGIFNMGTGRNSVLGQLYSWNYRTQTPYHEGTCGQVTGSNSEFYEVSSGKDSIQMFMPDLCQFVTFNYAEEKYVHGILGRKYEVNQMLDNGTNFPENKCFCDGECVPSGMLNVSSCKYGSPFFISLPHFHNADPYYINSVEGIDAPEKEKHELSITIEPISGIPLEAVARLQGNLLIQPVPSLLMYDNAPRRFFPLGWSDQKAQLPPEQAFRLKLFLKLPIIGHSLGILIIFVGLSLMSHIAYKRYKMKSTFKSGRNYLFQEENVPLKFEYRSDVTKK